MRNPWRFGFDGRRLIIADVGTNRREEVNYLPTSRVKGANFGWPQFEGEIVFDNTRPGPDPPTFLIFTYDHSGGRCAIIGGYVVRDPSLAKLQGRYLYDDLCTGEGRELRRARRCSGSRRRSADRITLTSLSGFGLNANKQIYLAQIIGNVSCLVSP